MTNGGSDSVSVVDTSSNTVLATVPVGADPFGVAIAPAVLFSAFSAKLGVSPARFELKGTSTLGARGTINPRPSLSRLKWEAFGTVPAGSFKAGPHGTFTFEGTINGVALQMRLAPLGGNSYSIQAEASGVDLRGLSNPVHVTLTIGINRGTTSVATDFD